MKGCGWAPGRGGRGPGKGGLPWGPGTASEELPSQARGCRDRQASRPAPHLRSHRVLCLSGPERGAATWLCSGWAGQVLGWPVTTYAQPWIQARELRAAGWPGLGTCFQPAPGPPCRVPRSAGRVIGKGQPGSSSVPETELSHPVVQLEVTSVSGPS